ncbi:deoxyribonuclease IV [Pseudalkalibacillus caeni]|uniref:Deoxyribonuclease IV n=1 Tax=Exobacillus caeni TaxID=2574798 RepID=A0A5R9F1X0_9BACL|nr:deoxyribonuclease IV [Pseudalkalibacillus caeni]TLS35458.1 deoxyribonuclease IV [Pseudalkalibacillus caeni]
MLFGSHVSIRNGYLSAAKTARERGGKSFQYFPKNPRSILIKKFDPVDAEKCAKYCKEHNLVSIAHTPYPTQLSLIEKEKQRKMADSITNDLEIAEACGSIGVVVHFGTYKNENHNPLEGYQLMIELLNNVLSNWNGKALLLIENNAGKSGKMGTTFEELVKVRKLVDFSEKIGFCFDTCHAFASGLWNGENWSEVEKKGKELGYFDHLKAIHLNDSKYASGSLRDRHENVGKGHIGVMYMKKFINSNLLRGIPMILETPSSTTYTHREEIAFLKTITTYS